MKMVVDGLKVEGHKGTWYVIAMQYYKGERVYLLEHETYGDGSACLIVNGNLNIICDDVWNGFLDLEYLD